MGESAEIIVMLHGEFNAFAKNPDLDLNPAELAEAQDKINAIVYPCINDGVYRCGFAASQEAYDDAVGKLFDALEQVDEVLGKQRYLCGNQLTLADFPNILGFARDLYQTPGVKETFNPEETKKHYYGSHRKINPLGIVPVGPSMQVFEQPHDRQK